MLIDKLLTLKSDKKALILTHDNPDPDAIAASWGLAYLLRKKLELASTVAYGGLIGRAENRALVKELKIPMVHFNPSLITKHGLIMMIDCQPHTGNCSLPPDVTPDIIIDHHPIRPVTKYHHWAYIKAKIGSTSTIITQAIRSSRLPLSQRLATALFYAIRSETKDLGWEVTGLDYENYIFLLPKINFKTLYHIEHPSLTADYYRIIKEALNKSRIYEYIVACPLGEVPYPELPAEIADFLIYRQNINISLVLGQYKGDIYLSLRSLNSNINSADLMQLIIKGIGTGGGHDNMAGGKIFNVPLYKVKAMEKTVIKRLRQALSLTQGKEKRLF